MIQSNREFWYVGCASSQLGSQLLSTQLLDLPVVLYRNEIGKATALLDRCCHRGFPLSKSKLKDGRIECGFHGWQYNAAGEVVRIPSQNMEKPIPKSFCVKSFPCIENDGYVWLWAGSGKPGPVPTIPEVKSGSWIQGSRIIECNYMRALEITFDAPHIYFLHPTHPATVAAKKHGFSESEMELRLTDTGCIAFGPPASSEQDEIPKYSFAMEFILPGRVRFSMGGAAYMEFFTMPLSENKCRMDWILTNWAPNSTEGIQWSGEGGDVVEEDQFALEQIQKTYEREGESFEKSVESDSATLLLRRILKAAEAGEFTTKDFGPKRRVFGLVGAARFD